MDKARTVHPFPLQNMMRDAGNTSLSMRRGALIIATPDNELEDLSEQEKKAQKNTLPKDDLAHILLKLSDDVRGTITSSSSSVSSPPPPPHSIYYKWEKYIIVCLGGISGFWSSISSPIYLPVLPILQEQFHVTEEAINITIVVYLIFQGFSPILFSTVSDKYGRRVVILSCLLIYALANIGLALNNCYTGLVLLRCLQAMGISPTLSVASGVASDISTKSDRGSFIGLSAGLSLLGQALGALIGGLISTWLGWRAIFWFLAISSLSTLLLVYIFLPETTRSLVGNGSTHPEHWYSIAPILLVLPSFRDRIHDRDENFENTTLVKQPKVDILSPYRILKSPAVILTLVPCALYYALWLIMLTTLSTSLSKTYHYLTFQIGISYLPSGLGGLLGTIISGRLLDWCYNHYYNKINNNILNTRLYNTYLPSFLSIIGSILFGWGIEKHLHVSVALVGSFMVSFGAMSFLVISTTILVDLFPHRSSGSSSCVNLTRCWCAAIFLVALNKMQSSLTIGGCYTFMAVLCGLSDICIYFLYHVHVEQR